ncbi:MAG: hypothetical protein EBU88_05665 [Acidobacteria bacterium]|nr:hypothetical protein [Acidobacteriota bacterium]
MPRSLLPHPYQPDTLISLFETSLDIAKSHKLYGKHVHETNIGETRVDLAPGLENVSAWCYGISGTNITSPGPLLEVQAGHPVIIRWNNCLPASMMPDGMKAKSPFATTIVTPQSKDDQPQNQPGSKGAPLEEMVTNAPG